MTPAEIVSMAQEVGLYSGNPRTPGTGRTIEGRLLRFAALVAAHEGVVCVQICEIEMRTAGYASGAYVCAKAIRARGKNHE